MLEVLPAEDMNALLEEELTRRGFASSGGVATRVEPGGAVVRVDVAARKIHVGIREANAYQYDTSELVAHKISTPEPFDVAVEGVHSFISPPGAGTSAEVAPEGTP